MSLRLLITSVVITAAALSSGQLPKAIGQKWGEGLGVNTRGPEINLSELARMKDAGFSYVRFNSNWQSTEVLPNTFVWVNTDAVVPVVLNSGMKMVVMLAYGNSLYERYPKSPAAISAFSRFCRLAIERYQGKGILWEIWNEPNHERFWEPVPNPTEFSTLLKATINELKATFPNEYIMAPGLSAFDFPYMESMFQQGALANLDAFSMHPYRPDPPENTLPDFGTLYQLLHRYKTPGQKLDVINSEWGYPGRTEADALNQLRYTVRQYLNPLVAGVPVSIHYDWSDSSLDPNARDSSFGLNDFYMQERAPLRLFRFYNQQLGGYTYKGRIDTGDDKIFALIFSNGLQEKLLIWNALRTPQTVFIPASNGAYEVRSDFGSSVSASASGQSLPITISDQVVVVAAAARYDAWRFMAKMSGLPTVNVLDDPQELAESIQATVESFFKLGIYGTTQLIISDQEEGSTVVKSKVLFQVINALAGPAQPPSLAQIETKLRDLPVSRDWTSRPRQITLEVRTPSFPVWRYRMRVLKTTPIGGSLEPRNSTGDGVDFVFSNPSKMPFAGTIKGTSGAANWERAFSVVGGQSWKAITVPTTTAAMAEGYKVTLLNDSSNLQDDQRIVLESPFSILSYFDDYIGYSLGSPVTQYEIVRNPASAGGTFSLICEQAPAGLPFGDAKSMAFSYTFGTKSQFAVLALKAKQVLPGKPYKLTVWVYGDNSKAILHMRVLDANKTYHQTSGQKVDWIGWRQVTFNMVDGFAANYEGTGSATVAYPVTLHQNLLISQTTSSVGTGKLFFANMAAHSF